MPAELLGASRDDGIRVLDVVDDPAVADVALALQTVADGLLVAAAALLLVRRLRAGDFRWRRLAAPLYLAGIAALVFVAVLDVLHGAGLTAAGGWPADLLDAVGIAVVALLPLAFLAGCCAAGSPAPASSESWCVASVTRRLGRRRSRSRLRMRSGTPPRRSPTGCPESAAMWTRAVPLLSQTRSAGWRR